VDEWGGGGRAGCKFIFGLDSHCPSGWGKVCGMKLKNAEIGREKLNGSTVKSLNGWSPPRGDRQVAENQGRSSLVKLRQALEFKKWRDATGHHGPLVPRRSQTAGTGQTCQSGVWWSWRTDISRVVPAIKHQNYETKPILKCNYRLILPI
jgi:hypothetical protein